MRLAILHFTLPPVIGGVERVIRDQAVALQRLGHQVDLMDRKRFDVAFAEPKAAPEKQGDVNATPAPLANYDGVLIHNVMTMPFDLDWTRQLQALSRQHPQIRWINWVHDLCAVNPAYRHITWTEPAPAMQHVAVSEARRQEYAQATGLPAESIQVIPNGLDVTSVLGLTPRIAALPLAQAELVLLHPARLVRRKNIELGMKITAGLVARGCRVAYLITGAPDPHQSDGVAYHRELKQLGEVLQLESQVHFLGDQAPLEEADVRSLYAVADALLFPSTGEGFGLPLLEALAHRMPIFCSDLPVHHEVLGEAAHYFHTGTEPDLISAQIMRWYESCQPTRHRRLLLQAHDMVRICQEHLEPLLLAANDCFSHP